MATLANLARMTVSTGGSSDLVLGSAVSGFLSFDNAGVSGGESIYYAINDPGATSPTASEIGTATYVSSITSISGRVPLNSTSSNAVISVSTAAHVFVCPAAESFRELLTADRTYYVRTNGSDTNNGLANSSAGAFLTIQKAINTAAALDLSIYNVTIQLSSGTYTASNSLKTIVGAGVVTIVGSTGTPANVLIDVTGGNCFGGSGISAYYALKGMKLQTTTTGFGISASGGALRVDYGAMDFGTMAAGYSHVAVTTNSNVVAADNYSITGNATHHIFCQQAHASIAGRLLTLTSTPAFSEFVRCYFPGLIEAQTSSYSGGATGSRFGAYDCGVIYTNGGSSNFFPGNSAGSGSNPGVSPYGRYS